eukprot:m.136321 g.136321  ORF g.136321 m.136321 type:complete len:460 (-) comp13936_c0_seq2:158-1537(-)
MASAAAYCACAPVASIAHPVCTLGAGYCEALSCVPLSTLHCNACLNCGRTASPTGSDPSAAPEGDSYYIITGANRNIGYWCASALAQRGFRVILLCRNQKLGEAALKRLQSRACRRRRGTTPATAHEPPPEASPTPESSRIELGVVDLGDICSIERFCSEFCSRTPAPQIKGLVLNAGMLGRGSVAVNHLGHAALALGLLGPLEAGRGTVVTVASVAGQWVAPGLSGRLCHELRTVGSLGDQEQSLGDNLIDPPPIIPGFPTEWSTPPTPTQPMADEWAEYSDSKAANIVFTRALARRYGRRGIRAMAYHPGVMLTELWRDSHTHESVSFAFGRALCALCVKHPCVSGSGLAGLVAPRGCYPHNSCCIAGTGGGYYQQCCCLCTVPVRSIQSPLATEDALWNDTLIAVAAGSAELMQLALPMLSKGEAPKARTLVHPSLPGTELLAMAPMPCCCLAALC